MKNKNIVEASYDVICKKLGIISAINFTNLVKSTNDGRDLVLENMNDAEQISTINSFWRKQLAHVPEGTAIRSWLCEGNDANAYLEAFEHNWVQDVHKSGLI